METGVYLLSMECSSHDSFVQPVMLDIHSTDPTVDSEPIEANCPIKPAWATFTNAYVLEANKSYTVSLYRGSEGDRDAYVDNIKLTLLHMEHEIDLDTGLIVNGDFMGPDGWVYENDASHLMNRGEASTTTGVAQIREDNSITQDVVPTSSAQYTFSFSCFPTSGEDEQVHYEVSDSSGPIASETIVCPHPVWKTFQETMTLAANETYTVKL